MKALEPLRRATGTAEEDTLDAAIADAVAFGRPRVSMMNDGTWHAAINLRTDNSNIEATVRSEFNHATPVEAVREAIRKAKS